VSKTACIAEAAYAYKTNDTYEDGICCQYGAGKFQITVNVEQVATGSSRHLPDMVREFRGRARYRLHCRLPAGYRAR
jgi:hypothetical protein